MPSLSNTRHERFAQALAEGRVQVEAYGQAGYARNRSAASRLAADPAVKARVAELVKPGAERSETTVETLLKACWDIVLKATAAEEFSVASATIERAAKIAGLWVDRQTNQTHTVVYGAQPVTADEWAERFAATQ